MAEFLKQSGQQELAPILYQALENSQQLLPHVLQKRLTAVFVPYMDDGQDWRQ